MKAHSYGGKTSLEVSSYEGGYVSRVPRYRRRKARTRARVRSTRVLARDDASSDRSGRSGESRESKDEVDHVWNGES